MQLRRTVWTRLGIVGAAGGRGADRMLDRTQVEVFRFLWLFLPQPRIARDIRFQHLLLSRFLSEGGQQTLMFGALVSVARNGGSALDVALIGIAALLPPTVLALYGGIVADELPKRVALAGAYTGQALLCFAVALHPGANVILRLAVAGGDVDVIDALLQQHRQGPLSNRRSALPEGGGAEDDAGARVAGPAEGL